MKDAQVIAVEGDMGDVNLEALLEEHGIDGAGGTLIPIVIPISDLDQIPTVLKNLSENRGAVTDVVKKKLEPPAAEEEPEPELAYPQTELKRLAEENKMLHGQNTELLEMNKQQSGRIKFLNHEFTKLAEGLKEGLEALSNG